MSEPIDLTAAVQELLDRQAIADLIHAYCYHFDQHEPTQVAALFTADATVDYDAGLNAAVRAQHPDGIDAIVHAAGDGAQLATLLKPGGRIASTIGLTAEQVEDTGAKVTTIMVMPTTDILDRLAAMVIRGDLTVPIYRTYELEGAGRALKDFTAGKRGKVAITVR